MGRARIFKKTLHYLWRDTRDISLNILFPALGCVIVGLFGFYISNLGAEMTVDHFGLVERTGVGFLLIYAMCYAAIVWWIYACFERAKRAIYNENKELVNNIKDPK